MAIHASSRRASNRSAWWIGVLFSIGSACFLIGPSPGFVQLVGSSADGVVFFVGSVFFTSAAYLQYRAAGPADRAATLIQLIGTLFFNISTFRAMEASFDTTDVDRLVWAPEVFGSICFLISGLLAYAVVRHGDHDAAWRIGLVNLIGCVLFMISSIAAYVVPSTGDVLALAASNWTTALGALCFLIGAVMLLPRGAAADG